MDLNLVHFETSEFPAPLHRSENRRVLYCSMPTCFFYCYRHVNYDDHLTLQHFCSHCNIYISRLDLHLCPDGNQRGGHVDANFNLDLTWWREVSRAHRGAMVTYMYREEFDTVDVETAFTLVDDSLTTLLTQLLEIHQSFRLELNMGYKMYKIISSDGEEWTREDTIYFKSDFEDLFNSGEIEELLFKCSSRIIQKKEDFVEHSSGWILKYIESFQLKIGEMRLFSSARPQRFLHMPFQARRSGYINFRNKDSRCFHYSIVAALHMDEQKEENRRKNKTDRNLTIHTTWSKYLSRYDWADVEPVIDVYNGISLFEMKHQLCINILTNKDPEGEDIVWMRRGNTTFTKIINLFMIWQRVKGKNKHAKYHFVLITDVHQFLGTFDLTNRRVWFCQKCFRRFTSNARMNFHFASCSGYSSDFQVKEIFPNIGETLSFSNYAATLPYPMILVWDSEALSIPVDKQKGKSTHLNYRYDVAAYSLVSVVMDDTGPHIKDCEYYASDEGVMKHFLRRCYDIAKGFLSVVRMTNNACTPTLAERQRHDTAKNCFLCAREFNDGSEGMEKVVKNLHHCHQTGRYLGALCSRCNLSVKYKFECVVVSHNGSAFDHSFVIKNLDPKLFNISKTNVIAKSSEKIIQIELTGLEPEFSQLATDYLDGEKPTGSRYVKLRFIDSLQFVNGSLSTLSSNLRKENDPRFSLLRESIPFIFPGKTELTQQEEDLIMAKLPFPFTALNSFDCLQPSFPMPEREAFNNKLKGSIITDEEWSLVQQVIQTFGLRGFGDYVRLYCIIDSVLLCVVFQQFREFAIGHLGLDPAYFCTSPGLGWAGFLLHSKVDMDFVRSPEIHQLVEESIRGGVSFNTVSHVQANYKESMLGYDETKEESRIISVDVVSLYPTAMCEKLPKHSFEMCTVEELEAIDWASFDCNGDTGYIIKCDLIYEACAQDVTLDFPLAPSRYKVRFSELSAHQRDQFDKLAPLLSTKSFMTSDRLIPHMHDKIGYVLHCKILKYYLERGLTLKKIHTGFKFYQEATFKDYIMHNVEKRKQATTDSHRALIKLLSNCCYGKCLQNPRSFIRTKFVTSIMRARELMAKPESIGFVILNENLSMVFQLPKKIKMRYPRVIGTAILDIAKAHFYRAIDGLKASLNNQAYVCSTDTDGAVLYYKGSSDSLYRGLFNNRHAMDLSPIPPGHEFWKQYGHLDPEMGERNRGVTGKLKAESLEICSGIFHKSKQYNLLYNKRDAKTNKLLESRIFKGMTADSIKDCDHWKYKSIVDEGVVTPIDVQLIRSYGHTLFQVTVRKLSFHALNFSRVFVSPNESYPIGYHRLPQIQARVERELQEDAET